MSTKSITAALAASFVTFVFCLAKDASAADDEPQRGRRAFDEAKFENPEPWALNERAAGGVPGGTDWDNPYRSLIQTSAADDPPVLVRHQAPKPITAADHPPVPETINDPHSYWYGVLLADALEKAGVTVQRHIGPDIGKDEADAARVAAFIIKHLGTK